MNDEITLSALVVLRPHRIASSRGGIGDRTGPNKPLARESLESCNRVLRAKGLRNRRHDRHELLDQEPAPSFRGSLRADRRDPETTKPRRVRPARRRVNRVQPCSPAGDHHATPVGSDLHRTPDLAVGGRSQRGNDYRQVVVSRCSPDRVSIDARLGRTTHPTGDFPSQIRSLGRCSHCIM